MSSGDVGRVSEEFFKRVSERCLWTCVSFGASEGVSECSGLVLYSKCSSLEKL